MDLDDPFPINKCSGRIRSAILTEFKGRCPTIREVAAISDAHWLTVPNIGPTTLEELRSLATHPQGSEIRPAVSGMTNAELLSRLNRLQRELNIVTGEIRSRIASGTATRHSRSHA